MIEVHLRPVAGAGRSPEVVINRFPFYLGRRRDCDLPLTDPCVSRRHCCVFPRGEEVCIQDLESTNGTYVNGQRLDVPQALNEGDLIGLGPFTWQVTVALVTHS